MLLSVQSQDLIDDVGYDAGYRMIREAGFEAIDWNLDHAWKANQLETAEALEGLCIFERPLPEVLAHYGEELSCIRKHGLTITQAHAPFPPYFSHRPEVLDYAIRIYSNLILFCGQVGCPRLVIHGISLRQNDPADRTHEDCLELNRRLYTSLIPALHRAGNVTVCLENLFSRYNTLGNGFRDGICSDPNEAAGLIDSLNAEAGRTCFGLCLDTGHLNLLRRDFRTYVPVLGKRIVALHIHDNSQDNDRHLAPYTGNICWEEFLREMKGIGYSGDLSFETFAQIRQSRLPLALAPAFLGLIAQIGAYFRSQLQ